MQEPQDTKVEAAGSIAGGSPANTQLSGVKMSVQKNQLLYGLIPGNLINRAGKGEIKKTGGTNEI